MQARKVENLEKKLQDKEAAKNKLLTSIKQDKSKHIADKRYSYNVDISVKEAKREALMELKMNQRSSDPAKQA